MQGLQSILSLFRNKFNKFNYTGARGSAVAQCRVLDLRPKGRGFEPHRLHSVVVLEQDTFILA